MAIVVEIKKEQLEYYLDCLANGKSIYAPCRGWTGMDILALAGACFFVRFSHGPAMMPGHDGSDISDEHAEAIEETFRKDLFGAIDWFGNSTRLIHEERYDDEFDSTHEVKLDGEDWSVLPLKGFRSE